MTWEVIFRLLPYVIYIKVKFPLEQTMKVHGGGYSFFNLGTRWGVRGQRHAQAALPLGRTQYPLYRRLGRPQGWSGQVCKILPPPGFDPQTIQPVVSRCSNCAIQVHVHARTHTHIYIYIYIYIKKPISYL
jgi:hypothetical protein